MLVRILITKKYGNVLMHLYFIIENACYRLLPYIYIKKSQFGLHRKNGDHRFLLPCIYFIFTISKLQKLNMNTLNFQRHIYS